MTTVLITGGIGSGKSCVCRVLAENGIPVYDSDSMARSLYDRDPELAAAVIAAMGGGVADNDGKIDRKALADMVFSDREKLSELENLVHPAVYRDFDAFRREHRDAELVVFESAIVLQRGLPEGLVDKIVYVDAPLELRVARASQRDGKSREETMKRVAAQPSVADDPRIDLVLRNDGTEEELRRATMEMLEKLKKNNIMKTDLARILSISGQSGLFLYIAQSRNGAIVESLVDKKRTQFGMTSRITTLADISIYTDDEEMKLQDVFGKLHEVLGEADAPGAKASSEELKALFEKAVPTYDRDRFLVSHMKKVVTWYNCLKNNASLDFMTDEERQAEYEAKQAEK